MAMRDEDFEPPPRLLAEASLGATAFLLDQMVRAALREGMSAEWVRHIVTTAIEAVQR